MSNARREKKIKVREGRTNEKRSWNTRSEVGKETGRRIIGRAGGQGCVLA